MNNMNNLLRVMLLVLSIGWICSSPSAEDIKVGMDLHVITTLAAAIRDDGKERLSKTVIETAKPSIKQTRYGFDIDRSSFEERAKRNGLKKELDDAIDKGAPWVGLVTATGCSAILLLLAAPDPSGATQSVGILGWLGCSLLGFFAQSVVNTIESCTEPYSYKWALGEILRGQVQFTETKVKDGCWRFGGGISFLPFVVRF